MKENGGNISGASMNLSIRSEGTTGMATFYARR